MKFKFELNGLALKAEEAKSLMQASSSDRSLTIDLSNHIDEDLLDAKKLFSLSIEKGQLELATIAARLAMEPVKVKVSKKRGRRGPKQTSIPTLAVEKLTVEEGIENIATKKTLSSVGAVMLLIALSRKDALTLREVATDQVNHMCLKRVNSRSTLFNGFTCVHGLYQPVVAKATKGIVTYHGSPSYNAIREGAALLIKGGFATGSSEVQYNSDSKSKSVKQTQLCRTVYKFSLTKTGKQMIGVWSDAEDFVFGYWNNRVN